MENTAEQDKSMKHRKIHHESNQTIPTGNNGLQMMRACSEEEYSVDGGNCSI
jgi:hypothetical protein